MKNIVFVYGTLRKNLGWNHLLKNSEFIGEGISQEKYSMYADSIPYVVESEKYVSITGEVYLVDDSTLKILDQLEGHPNWYKRKEIPISINNSLMNCWIYFYPNPKGERISSGDYFDFIGKKLATSD